MSDPRRWSDSDAPAEVRELLRHAEAPRALNERSRSRSRSRVVALSALPMAAGFMLWLPQLALGAVLGAAGTGLVVVATEHFKSAPPVSAPAGSVKRAPRVTPPLPVPPAPVSAVALPEPEPAPAPAAAMPRGSSPVSSARSEREPPVAEERSSFDREIALVEQARRQLNTNPATALQVLFSHESQFPGGQLRIEREFLIVDALVRTGNRPAAEARARALEAQAPRSLYGERLRRILAGRSH